MGMIVQFDWNRFSAAYPEIAGIGESLATEYFGIATQIQRNDGGGPITDPVRQLSLLNMLVAHVAQLFAPRDANDNPAATGNPPPSVVGQVTSASEGSVSVGTQAMKGYETAQAAWLAQTRYGAMYWAATASFRTMRYRPFCDIRRLTH